MNISESLNNLPIYVSCMYDQNRSIINNYKEKESIGKGSVYHRYNNITAIIMIIKL